MTMGLNSGDQGVCGLGERWGCFRCGQQAAQTGDRICGNGLFFLSVRRRWAEEIGSSATVERDRGERVNEAGGAGWRQCTAPSRATTSSEEKNGDGINSRAGWRKILTRCETCFCAIRTCMGWRGSPGWRWMGLHYQKEIGAGVGW